MIRPVSEDTQRSPDTSWPFLRRWPFVNLVTRGAGMEAEADMIQYRMIRLGRQMAGHHKERGQGAGQGKRKGRLPVGSTLQEWKKGTRVRAAAIELNNMAMARKGVSLYHGNFAYHVMPLPSAFLRLHLERRKPSSQRKARNCAPDRRMGKGSRAVRRRIE
jgi:hypothetical protein